MAKAQTTLNKKYVILVEGLSDKAFLDALISHYAIPDFQVIAPADINPGLGGVSAFEQLLNSLPIRDGFSNVTAVLIVSDNDDDPAASFESVVRAIKDAEPFDEPPRKFLAPKEPESKSESEPTIVVLMLPRRDMVGNLESLCFAAAIHSVPKLVACVQDLIRCADISIWPKAKLDKSQVRSLIAVANIHQPDMSLPKVWVDVPKLFPVEAPPFREIVEFLRDFPQRIK